jgi:CBS domain-containing protein
MKITAAQIMSSPPLTVSPELSVPELENRFLTHKVGGFAVVEGGSLVGVVGRSDVIKKIAVERSYAEVLSDYYLDYDYAGFRPHFDDSISFTQIAENVGARIDHLKVKDVMNSNVISVSPAASITAVCRKLLEHRIHRMPVVDGDKLVGIISTSDVVRWVAESD